MALTINNILSSWVDRKLSKQAAPNVSGMLKGLGNFLSKVPGPAKKALKVGTGAGILGLAGETGVKTLNNWVHGNPDMGTPSYTEKQIGNLANMASTPFRPVLQNAAQAAANGVDLSPKAQEFLDFGANMTDPNKVRNAANTAIDTLNNRAVGLATNVGQAAGNTLGKGFGHGMAAGVMDDLIHHPIPTILGGTIIGAGPAMAYDAITYKRRKEEAERNKAIMRFILKNENQSSIYKKAGIGSTIMNALRDVENHIPGSTGTPTANNVERLFNKYVYRPSGANPSKLNDLLSKYTGQKTIPNREFDKIKEYPQTLINNSLFRHPLKTAIGASAGLGTATTAMQSRSPDSKYNRMYDTRTHFLENWGKNMATAPESLFKGLELGAVKGIKVTGPTFDKLQTIKSNVMNDVKFIPSASILKDKMNNSRIAAQTQLKSQMAGDTNSSNPYRNYLNYAGVGALASSPLISYMLYRNHANKKLNRLDNTNDKLMQRTEDANIKADAQ